MGREVVTRKREGRERVREKRGLAVKEVLGGNESQRERPYCFIHS